MSGMEAICQYLQGAGYGEAAEAIQESSSAFERWCDNQIIHTIQPEKYHPFSIGPLVAYVLARENEIKTVRIILTGRFERPAGGGHPGKDKGDVCIRSQSSVPTTVFTDSPRWGWIHFR